MSGRYSVVRVSDRLGGQTGFGEGRGGDNMVEGDWVRAKVPWRGSKLRVEKFGLRGKLGHENTRREGRERSGGGDGQCVVGEIIDLARRY